MASGVAASGVAAFGAAASLSLMGCASESLPEESGEEALAVATSMSGLLQVNARTLDGKAPARGANGFDLEVIQAGDDTALSGLTLTLTPWMPAMGHGTSVRPTVTEVGDGHYHADDVYLFMPGLWELRIAIDGSIQDDAAPRFQIR